MDRTITRRTFILSSLIAIFIAIALFHHALICHGMKWYLSSRLPKGEALKVSYEKGKWKKGAFVLHHVEISRQTKKKAPLLDMKIKDLRFVFAMELFPFKFNSKVVVETPEIDLLNGDFRMKRMKSGLYEAFDEFLFSKEMEINQARLTLGSNDSLQAYFSFNSGQDGKLSLAKTREELKLAPLHIDFKSEREELEFDFIFRDLDLAWLFSIAQFLPIPIDKGMDLTQGHLTGHLNVGWAPSNQISQVQYDVKLHELSLSHTDYDLVFSAHEIHSKEHLKRSNDPFFDKIWPYFIGDSEFSTAKVVIGDKGTIELLGKLQFSSEDLPLADFHGLLIKGDREYPMQLVAEGLIKSDKNWRVAIDLSLGNKMGEHLTHYLSVTSKGPEKYFFETKFQGVSQDQIELAGHLLRKKLPYLNEMVIKNGTFNGELVGWIQGGRFQRIEVTEIAAQQLRFLDESRNMYFSAKKLKGSGEFDFSTPDFFDGSLWELSVVEGEFRGPDDIIATDLQADMAMHDQYVKPSSISGSLGDIQGDILLEGLYNNLNLKVDLALSLVDLLPFWGQEKPNIPIEFQEKLALDLDFQLKSANHLFAVEGTLNLARDKKEVDTLSINLNWDREKLRTKGWIRGISEGWFIGENLSSETFNLPLKWYDKDWHGEGTVSLKGILSTDRLELSLDPTNLRYISPYIILEAGEHSPNCILRYEFNDEQWAGTIPLKKAMLSERSFGLNFESFSSDIELEGENFRFKNVSAIADGIGFKGEITFDAEDENTAKLQIVTNQIEGSTDAAMIFLRHFKEFETLQFPLEGRISSGEKGMFLEAFVGKKEELLKWDVTFDLKEGKFALTPVFKFEDLATRLQWSWNDQTLRFHGSEGTLCLNGANRRKNYHLNIPLAEADFRRHKLKYDLRVETPTLDICRFVGKAHLLSEVEEIKVAIDSDLTRFFGAQIIFEEFVLGYDGTIERLKLQTDLSARDLYHHMDFIVHAGVLPLKASTLEEMQSPRFEGRTHLDISFNRAAEELAFEAKSDHFVFGTMEIDELSIHAKRSGKEFRLGQFKAGSLSMAAEMVKEKAYWRIPSFKVTWKNSHLQTHDGFFHQDSGLIHLPFKNLQISLDEILKLVPKGPHNAHSYISGQIASSGIFEIDLAKGWRNWGIKAELELACEEFGKAHLRVESPHHLKLSYAPSKGLEIAQADFHFFHPRSNQLWAKCHLDALKYSTHLKQWMGTGFKVVAPPEMLHHLGATHAVPYLGADAECLVLFDQPFRWDNQMEVTFDFHHGPELNIQGRLKEGYYWIRDKAWLLNDFCFNWQGENLVFKMNTLLDENPFDVRAEVSLTPHLQARVKIQETIQEQQASDMPLTLVTDWSEDEGFYIHSVEGMVCGLDFSFHRDPRGSFSQQMVLTGQVKIDVPRLARFLPQSIQESIKQFEVGQGYEISGDCILSKDNLFNSHFAGYLKGKRFELMGSEMETLLSEIAIRPDLIELSHFNLSDEAGIFSMNEMRIEKMPDQKWNMTIPHLTVQDFRPSLLKKIGRYRGRIKPLTVRELSFHNIRGTLGNAKTFAGEGSLYFTNTFKRDYNILDIPFEILGRLGLDTGLLVPVRGRLEYVISDGKVFLTELSSSYSEGKRSKFYLSPSQPSYIDFDGNIDLNIKMRQYVLLKITEPFTLSIDGTFSEPRYSLK